MKPIIIAEFVLGCAFVPSVTATFLIATDTVAEMDQ